MDPLLYSCFVAMFGTILSAFAFNSICMEFKDGLCFSKIKNVFYNYTVMIFMLITVTLSILLTIGLSNYKYIIIFGISIIIIMFVRLNNSEGKRKKLYCIISIMILLSSTSIEYFKFRQQCDIAPLTANEANDKVQLANKSVKNMFEQIGGLPTDSDPFRVLPWMSKQQVYSSNSATCVGFYDYLAYMNPS